MKAQSLVIQFLLFFMIGLGLFLSVSNLFNIRLTTFGSSVADVNRKLVNSYISSIAISSFDTCRKCDNVNIIIKLENRTANYIMELALNSSGLNVITQPEGKNYLTTIHNLNYSIANLQGSGSSNKPIILTYDKTKNELRLI